MKIENFVTPHSPEPVLSNFDATPRPAAISWGSVGAVDTATARAFAENIIRKCDEADATNSSIKTMTTAEFLKNRNNHGN